MQAAPNPKSVWDLQFARRFGAPRLFREAPLLLLISYLLKRWRYVKLRNLSDRSRARLCANIPMVTKRKKPQVILVTG